MIVSTIIITVRYAPDATMEEAEDDKAEFQHEIEKQFLSSVGSKEDIHVDYSTAEVTTHSRPGFWTIARWHFSWWEIAILLPVTAIHCIFNRE